MKKLGYFLSISALAIFSLVVLFPACEGPAGADGANGTNGANGANGANGLNGKDANAFCVKCHNADKFASVEAQFATSKHGEGETWAGDGNRNPCAMCHSYQGFKETKLTGRDTVAVVPAIPVALQCDACHDFHGTLDSTDFPNYALGHTEPVSLIYNNHASTIDFGNSSNSCAYCHQPRPRGTDFPIPTTGDLEYKVTTSRWGPHYGTQSIILNGTNGWEYAGSMAYTSTNHKGVATCASCHMAAGTGTENGGHTWRIANADDTKINITGCKKCHTDATTTDIGGKQTEIEGLLTQLADRLIALKLMNADDHSALVYNKEPGKMTPWTTKEAGAFFNYKVIDADRSMGVHNYKYTKALLVNSLEAIQ